MNNDELITYDSTHYQVKIMLQKCLYLNSTLFPIWVAVVALFLYIRFDDLGHLTKYLTLAVFGISIFIELTRLFYGHHGNILCRVPELAGFLMLSILMQLPLVSFFLLNTYLKSTPLEMTLHIIFWLMIFLEIVLGYFSFKEASKIAQRVYFSSRK